VKKRGAVSHRGIMNQRLLIRASGVKYAPELDLVVCFIEVIHNFFVNRFSRIFRCSNSLSMMLVGVCKASQTRLCRMKSTLMARLIV
jgi:hypothetical protein